MLNMSFLSEQDARTYVDNSGVADWEWSGMASAERFAAWLYQNRDGMGNDDPRIAREEFDRALTEYLLSEGENPDEYSVGR